MHNVITHRGLEPSRSPFFGESTFEAFASHIERGFGLEFDVAFTRDGHGLVVHDSNLKRISSGADTRAIADLSRAEVTTLNFSCGRLSFLEEILALIVKSNAVSALHLKARVQDQESLERVAASLAKFEAIHSRLIVFDVRPEAAQWLHKKLPTLNLGASVAHPFDKERYNGAVGGTLLTIEEVIALEDVYRWCWLDEWDTRDAGGGEKRFYTEETFRRLREHKFLLALVTPELHASSPGLLGGEAHSDAASHGLLMRRIEAILRLNPDAVCTDYPEEVRQLWSRLR